MYIYEWESFCAQWLYLIYRLKIAHDKSWKIITSKTKQTFRRILKVEKIRLHIVVTFRFSKNGNIFFAGRYCADSLHSSECQNYSILNNDTQYFQMQCNVKYTLLVWTNHYPIWKHIFQQMLFKLFITP